jgi:hypothetical protein
MPQVLFTDVLKNNLLRVSNLLQAPNSLRATNALLPTGVPPTLSAPTFAISDGAINTTQQVTISHDINATTTKYTVDGTDPSPSNGTVYSGPFNITVAETIKAYSVAAGFTDSAIGTITYAQQTTPTFSPVAGSYGPTQNVTISSASATHIYYKIGGPPSFGDETVGISVSVAATETVFARAVRTGFVNSAIGSAAYTINGAQATPTFSPVAGSYSGTQNVTIISAGADTIYYTTDGSTPTTGSTVYSTPVAISVTSTLKALAVKAGWTNSAIGSAAYTITAPAPALLATAKATTNGTSPITSSPAMDTTGATLLLVAFASYGGTDHAKTVTDNKGNNWHLLTEYDANGTTGNATASILLAYAFDSGSGDPLIVGAGHTVTADNTGFGSDAIIVQAWSNTLTTSAVFAAGTDTGVTASTGGGGTLIAPGAATPTDANDIVVSALGFAANSDPSIDTGFTLDDFDRSLIEHVAIAHLLAPNTTPVSPTWTIGFGGNMAANIAVFKHA